MSCRRSPGFRCSSSLDCHRIERRAKGVYNDWSHLRAFRAALSRCNPIDSAQLNTFIAAIDSSWYLVMDSSAQNERNMEGANPALAHTDGQMEKWIAAKVDGGAYLEYLIRRLFATIRLIQASQAKQEQSYISAERRQEAANILLELDDSQIHHSASLHAHYVRMPVELTVNQADEFVWEQFRLWMCLNAASADYRGGVDGVELAAADLKYILKKTLESATESSDEEDQKGTYSDGTKSAFQSEEMTSTLRGPAALDMIRGSTEYQECDPALREEFHKNVNCCKQGMVEEATDESGDGARARRSVWGRQCERGSGVA